MTTPKISVIIPVYKVEKFLPACLDSVLAQSFTDFELLLVNDGSPDNSGAICDEYAKKDNRVRVFHKKNEGVSKARNLGLDNAIGEWVVFVDSDDLLKVDSLKHLYDAREDGVDLIIAGDERVREGSKKPFFISPQKNITYTPACDFLKENFFNHLLGPCSKLIKRSLIEDNKLRFNEKISFAEDLFFILNLIYITRALKSISNTDYIYIIHKNSLISKSYNFDTEYYIHKSKRDWYQKLLKNEMTPHILNALAYSFTRPLKSLYIKPHRLARAERIEKLKMLYETEALIIDNMQDKSRLKKFRNNLPLLDRLLYSRYNGVLFIFIKIKMALKSVKNIFKRKNPTYIHKI